jgi:hypothetical protein
VYPPDAVYGAAVARDLEIMFGARTVAPVLMRGMMRGIQFETRFST